MAGDPSRRAHGGDHQVFAADRTELIAALGEVAVVQILRGHDRHVAEAGFVASAAASSGDSRLSHGCPDAAAPSAAPCRIGRISAGAISIGRE